MAKNKNNFQVNKILIFLLILSLLVNLTLAYQIYQIDAKRKELDEKIDDLYVQTENCQKQIAIYREELEKVSRVLEIEV